LEERLEERNLNVEGLYLWLVYSETKFGFGQKTFCPVFDPNGR
jgi:hypothetical protein